MSFDGRDDEGGELKAGSVLLDRFELLEAPPRASGGIFLALDRNFDRRAVALKWVERAADAPAEEAALRHEVELARTVSHPNVVRMHDLHVTPRGLFLAMQFIDGTSLHAWIRDLGWLYRDGAAHAGIAVDTFRRVARSLAAGLGAIHRAGIIHGDFKPSRVMVERTTGEPFISGFALAKRRARLTTARSTPRPAAGPAVDGGTPNYMSPERLARGGASVEDDLYALGLTLWEMLSMRVPEPGHHPPSHPIEKQLPFGLPDGLSSDELRQIFALLSTDPGARPHARDLRFHDASPTGTNRPQVVRPSFDPGNHPPYRGLETPFRHDAQGLLILYAANDPTLVGRVLPLRKPELVIGRVASPPNAAATVDLVIAEPTISGVHCRLDFRGGGNWQVEEAERPSMNGTYAEGAYDRARSFSLMHGHEAMIGEVRVKLVSFREGTKLHHDAIESLRLRDGLTGLPHAPLFAAQLDADLAFSRWSYFPLTLVWFRVRSSSPERAQRPSIRELQALRRASKMVVDLFDTLIIAITPSSAGLVSTGTFAVALLGQTADTVRSLVDPVLSQTRRVMPPGVELDAGVVEATDAHARASDLSEAGRLAVSTR